MASRRARSPSTRRQIPAGAEIVAASSTGRPSPRAARPIRSALRGAKFKGNDISQIAVLLDQRGPRPCWSKEEEPAVPRLEDHLVVSAPTCSASSSHPPGDARPGRSRSRSPAPTRSRSPDMGKSEQDPLDARGRARRRLPGDRLRPGDRSPGREAAASLHRHLRRRQDPRQPQLGGPGAAGGSREASRVSPQARLTLLVADGQSNKASGSRSAALPRPRTTGWCAVNPFRSNSGFDVVTFQNVPLEAGAMKATVTIDAGKSGCFDCLTLPVAVLSTNAQDRDGDGLLDVWESQAEWSAKPSRLASVYAGWPLADPTGAPLPDLGAMGASPDVQDIFVQVDFMTGADGHSSPARRPNSALQAVATALRQRRASSERGRPRACLVDGRGGSVPHQRALRRRGERPAFQSHVDPGVCSSSSTWTADCAIVPAPLARGGNAIAETPCLATGLTPSGEACAFPGFPGVVGWKNGFRAYRRRRRSIAANGGVACSRRSGRLRRRACPAPGRTSSTTCSSPTRWATAHRRTRSSRGRTPASPIPAVAMSW